MDRQGSTRALLIGFWEAVKMGLSSLAAYKMRASLTILGVVMGIMTVSVVSSIIAGLNNSLSSQLNKLGSATAPAGIQVDGLSSLPAAAGPHCPSIPIAPAPRTSPSQKPCPFMMCLHFSERRPSCTLSKIVRRSITQCEDFAGTPEAISAGSHTACVVDGNRV